MHHRSGTERNNPSTLLSRIQKAARATAVVQVFQWTSLVLSLATVPLYLKWLGQERYGVMLTGLSFAGYLMFSDAGLSWASMLLISQANGREDRPGIASIVRNSFSLAACSIALVAVLVSAALWALAHATEFSWLPQHPESSGILLAVGLSVACTLSLSPFYNLLIGIQEAQTTAIYQGIGRLLGTVIAIAMAAAGAHLGWVLGANAIGNLIAGLLAARVARQRFPWAFQPGSFWERSQIRQQVRTGVKSFGMQIGNVLFGTAPVLAISSAAGAQYVPCFSIPTTLLTAPLSILNSFNANLQPGYGEAFVRGETAWIAETVQRILRQTILVLGLLGSGFFLLAGPFVHLWTSGRIELQMPILGSVFAIAGLNSLLGTFRFALSGINRHRRTAGSELACGVIAVGLSHVAVRSLGYGFIGLGTVGAMTLTSLWILPKELKVALGGHGIIPGGSYWLRWAATVLASSVAGWVASHAIRDTAQWLAVVAIGSVTVGAFAGVGWFLMPSDFSFFQTLITKLRPSSLRPS